MEELPFTDLDKLELCDIAVNNGHVVIITDILRDKYGAYIGQPAPFFFDGKEA